LDRAEHFGEGIEPSPAVTIDGINLRFWLFGGATVRHQSLFQDEDAFV
jgi:hypothetical protein